MARAEIAGALRRRRETIDRLVAVVATKAAVTALDHAARYPAAAALLEKDDGRVLMRLPDGLNVEVHAVAPAQFAVAWHRLTGSEAHLAKLSALAGLKELTFDERGVSRAGRRLTVKEEADLYRHLGLPYIEPELREDEGEIEAALTGTLPPRLVRTEDVRGPGPLPHALLGRQEQRRGDGARRRRRWA